MNYTISSHWVLFCKKGVLRSVCLRSEVFWIVQPLLRKRVVLLKTEAQFFCWKYLPETLKCFFFLFACFREKWWPSFWSLANRQTGNQGILLSDWISWEENLLLLYFLHSNTLIPVRMILSLIKQPGKR